MDWAAKILEITASITTPYAVTGIVIGALIIAFLSNARRTSAFNKVLIDRLSLLALVTVFLLFSLEMLKIWVNSSLRPSDQSLACHAGILGVLDDGEDIRTNEYKLYIRINETEVFNQSVRGIFKRGNRITPLNPAFNTWEPLNVSKTVAIKKGDAVLFTVILKNTSPLSWVGVSRIYLTCNDNQSYSMEAEGNDSNTRYGQDGSSVVILYTDIPKTWTLQPN